jgi:hypothetical protein
MNTLPEWRNVALIVLAIEAIVISLPVLIAGYLGVRTLRQTQAALGPASANVRARMWQVQQTTVVVCSLIVAPIRWLQRTGSAIDRRLCSLLGRL